MDKNMGKYYLAVDIGASSGRHMIGYLEKGKIQLEEVYRFENGMANKDGKLLWDTGHLFAEIINGMIKCRKACPLIPGQWITCCLMKRIR